MNIICFFCKFIYFSPDQKCDRLANEKGGLQIICDILECFDSKDIIFPLRAFQRLIELNQVLYCKMMNDFQNVICDNDMN